ncbi:MAG: MaoC family dehydratase [Pseudomonadales bacterium]
MRYFEDFHVGEVIELARYTVDQEEIISFASQYDPQYFHCDPNAAQQSAIGGLIASGWHTCSIFMRLQCDAFLVDSASIASPGVDEVRWIAPVHPGDTLSGTVEVFETRRSRTRPDRGIVRCHCALLNQNADQVLTLSTAGFFSCRNKK